MLFINRDEDKAGPFFFSSRDQISRDVNGTDNFRSESASASVFEDMV